MQHQLTITVQATTSIFKHTSQIHIHSHHTMIFIQRKKKIKLNIESHRKLSTKHSRHAATTGVQIASVFTTLEPLLCATVARNHHQFGGLSRPSFIFALEISNFTEWVQSKGERNLGVLGPLIKNMTAAWNKN